MSQTDASQKLDRDRIHWQIWSNDYFDYDASPLLECEGTGVVAGCRELWLKTLEEGILDDGRPTFTGFVLCLAEHDKVMLPRDPLMNLELARLRQWRHHPDVIDLLAIALSYSYETPNVLLRAVEEASSAAEFCELLRQNLSVIPAAKDAPQTGCLCDTCATPTVVFLRNDPPGFQLFQCSNCGEIKRWCPFCGQGWLIHYLVTEDPRSRYICDDCRSVWDSHWNLITPEDRAYNVNKVTGPNPVQTRDFESTSSTSGPHSPDT